MNSVVKFSGSTALADRKSQVAALRRSRGEAPILPSGKNYLKLVQNVGFCYGQEQVQVSPKSVWAANPASIKHGFICTKDKPFAVLGDHLVSVYTNPELPDPSTFEQHPKGEWRFQMAIEMICVTGPDKGEEVLYTTSSIGGLKVLSDYLVEHIAQQVESDKPIPLLTMTHDSYVNKTHGGNTTFPIFEIVDWVSEDTTEIAAQVTADAAIEEPEPDPEPVVTTGRRTRRRA